MAIENGLEGLDQDRPGRHRSGDLNNPLDRGTRRRLDWQRYSIKCAVSSAFVNGTCMGYILGLFDAFEVQQLIARVRLPTARRWTLFLHTFGRTQLRAAKLRLP
jgi:hypothetical protein